MSNVAFLSRAIERMPRQVDQAVALLWLDGHGRATGEAGISAVALADGIHAAGLPRPNPTRLRESLQRDERVCRARNGFRLDVRYHDALTTVLAPFTTPIVSVPQGEFLPRNRYFGNRPYLIAIADEMNAAFEKSLFNSAAVMMRRLIESVLIDVFYNSKQAAAISRDGRIMGLEAIINQLFASSFTLSRNLKKELLAIKRLGDLAAHDRTFLVKREDLWEIRMELRRGFEELLHLAGEAALQERGKDVVNGKGQS